MFYLLVITAGLVCTSGGVLATELCLSGDFDSQLQHILQNFQLSRNESDKISQAMNDIKLTLRKRWPDSDVHTVGSLITGLGLITSDVDLYVRIPNCTSSEDRSHVLQEIETLLSTQPALYSRFAKEERGGWALFSLYHIPLQRLVDLVINNETGVYNRKLLRYYFTLDKTFTGLGVLLKLWHKVHGLSGHYKLSAYSLYLLIIFYLQQKAMAPPVFMLQIDSSTHFIDEWNYDYNELPYNTTNSESVYQLLGGFFKYYSDYNFKDYIVSPFVGRSLRRNAFVDIDKFPKEYILYNEQYIHELQLRIKYNLSVDTDLCIQDTVQHDRNTAELMQHGIFINFKNEIKKTAKLFDELPSDEFLGAILTLNPNNKVSFGPKLPMGLETTNQTIITLHFTKKCQENLNTTFPDS